MSIALARMADCLVSAAQTADASRGALHPDAALASGVIGRLAHNDALVRLRTPLVVTRQEVT